MQALAVVDRETVAQVLSYVAGGATGNGQTIRGMTCIGSVADFPEADGFKEGECATTDYIDPNSQRQVRGSVSVDPLLSDYFDVSSFGAGRLPTVRLGGLRMRGIVVQTIRTADYAYSELTWLAPDKSTCGRGAGTVSAQIDPDLLSDYVASGEYSLRRAMVAVLNGTMSAADYVAQYGGDADELTTWLASVNDSERAEIEREVMLVDDVIGGVEQCMRQFTF